MGSIEQEHIADLIENLKKKVAFLELLVEKTGKQKLLLAQSDFAEEEFRDLAEEKSTLLQGLNDTDNEFGELYEKVGDALRDNKYLYRAEIEKMQSLIKMINNKSVEIRTLETQNRAALELYYGNERKKIHQVKKSRQAAAGYYNAMSRINTIDPQFMDKKK